MAEDFSSEDFSAALKCVSKRFNVEKFREVQQEALLNLLKGKDVLVLQPTGSGKSIIFQSFPLIVDEIRKQAEHSCAVVISPLNSLMQDQVLFLNSIGVKAAFIGEEQSDENVKKGVEAGLFQVVFGSPESFLGCDRWRSMLTSTVYADRLCLIAVDEAHCIQHWGYSVKKGEQAFRKWFGRINEIRSLTKEVPLLALTATATSATRRKIMQSLEMEEAVIFNKNPDRKNIAYAVQTVTGGANQTFAHYIEVLKQKGTASDRVIIYCQTIKVVSHVYGVFASELGSSMYLKQGDVKSSMVEMYHSRIDDLNQETILTDFTKPNGQIRVLISTIAYGMGINCQGVKQIIHYGPSRNIEAYHQESGRAGRDSVTQCTAVILYSNVMLKFCDDAMKAYVHNNSQCRRDILLSHFDGYVCDTEDSRIPHECCDICQRKCQCDGTSCRFVYFPSQRQTSVPIACNVREVNKHQQEKLHSKLEYLKKSWTKTILDAVSLKAPQPALFTSPELVSGFSETQVQQVLTNCQKIFSLADVHSYVDIWEPCIAVDILAAIHQVFGDTDFVDINDPDEEEEDNVDLLSFCFWGTEQDDEMLKNIPDEFFILAHSSDSE